MKKKVIIITGVFLPEPQVSARLMADLAEKMSEDYDVIVLRPYPSRPMGFKMPEFDTSNLPYKVVTLDSYTCPKSSLIGRFRESISMGKFSIKYLKSHREEIAFVYNAPWHLFGRKMVADFCKKNHIPNMTPVQDIYPESLLSKLPNNIVIQQIIKSLLLPYDMATLHKANLVHTISYGMRDYLSKSRGLDISRFIVVRNWQDEREFVAYREKHPEDKKHPFTFMFMGNVGALAGLDVVIAAFVRTGLKEARLVIAGSGSAREALQKQATEHSGYNIIFCDVPFGKVPDIQAKADVMLLPVKRGFARSSIPSKMPAYMFSAKPILASVDSDSDSAKCINESGAGWVCKPDDIDALATAMRKCYQYDKQDLEAMGEAGYHYAINEFSRTKNLEILYEACKKIIEESEHYGSEE
jgi:glycosyltransferase involved in cell wall biosynthesis